MLDLDTLLKSANKLFLKKQFLDSITIYEKILEIDPNNLNAINQVGNLPWYTSFSFGRELQGPALKAWASVSVEESQKEIIKRASECSSASLGQYVAPEKEVVEQVQTTGFPASMNQS